MIGTVKNILESSAFKVFSDSLVLAQIFVVILFSENLFIIKYNTSLLAHGVNTNNFDLALLLWLFIFIAFSKICWVAFHFFKDLLFTHLGTLPDGEVENSVSFTSFMLGILVAVYLYILLYGGEQNFYPFDPERTLLQVLYILPFFASLLGCLILTFLPCKSFQ